MKRSFLSLLILSASIILSTGCKKTITDDEIITEQQTMTRLKADGSDRVFLRSAPASGVSVNAYGFLSFTAERDLQEFLQFVISNSHHAVQKYLADIGFTSNGASLYSYSNTNIVDPDEMSDYVFNSARVFEVGGTVVKSVDGDEAFFTMLSSDLSSTTYSELLNETFDSGVMNRFSSFSTGDSRHTFLQYVTINNTGTHQTGSFGRLYNPMFGKKITHHTNVPIGQPSYNIGTASCQQMVCNYDHVDVYFFWQNIDSWDTPLDNCHNISVANGCD